MMLAFIVLAGVVALAYSIFLFNKEKISGVTYAKPNYPIVGCALAYQSDPPAFLHHAKQTLGGVFALNLGGFRLVLLGDEGSRKVYYKQSENTLSSYACLDKFGFGAVLGHDNLYNVPGVARKVFLKTDLGDFGGRFYNSVLDSVKTTGKVDFMAFVRRAFFKASMDAFLGTQFLERNPSFLDTYMEWQDDYEDAMAKCFALPRVVSDVLFLRPIAKRRLQLVDTLSHYVKQVRQNSSCKMAPFIRSLLEEKEKFRREEKDKHGDNRSEKKDSLEETADSVVSHKELADNISSVFTAAPKNPAISFAQMVMFLSEKDNAENYRERFDEELNSAVARLLPSGEGAGEEGTATSGAASVLDSLPYVEACWNATMRRTNLPIGSIRLAQKDLRIPATESRKAIFVEKGTVVATSHLLACKEGTAKSFKVLFDETEGRDGVATHAFSGGVHKCPGMKIAGVMIKAAALAFAAKGVVLGSPECFDSLVFKAKTAHSADIVAQEATHSLPSLPPLCFKKATLGQRAAPWKVCMVCLSDY